ncbi:MAG: DUF3256 family protein [Paludibacter sp.]
MRLKILKKNNWLTLILLLICSSAFAQSVENLFVKMPDFLNPTLNSQNRLELIEYYKAHQGDSILNRFGKKATMKLLDLQNQHLIIQNTPSSIFEMKVNRMINSTPYVGIIRTVCAPLCHSTVEFYDTAWNVIPLQFSMPKAIEWIDDKQIEAKGIDVEWAKKVLEISFITLTFSNENNVLSAKSNTLDFISTEDRKIIKQLVSAKDFTYKLKNKIWTREP